MTPSRLVLACIATAAVPAIASAQADYILHGLVRDMRPGHPDFTAVSADAYVRIAGLTAPELAGLAPTLSREGGVEVTSPALDSEGNVIPPHLAYKAPSAGPGPTGIASGSPTILKDSSGVDAYAVSLVSVTNDAGGTSTWVYLVEELAGGQDLSHWNLALQPCHRVMPGTTPGYELGRDGSIKWDVGDSFTSGEFTIVLDQWYSAEMAPDNVLAKGGSKADTGEILAPSCDVGSPDPDPPAGCLELDDSLAVFGLPHDGAISSSVTFTHWFNSVLGQSISVSRAILMRWNSDTQSWRFRSTDFRPIDGALYGSATPRVRNGSFTMVFDAAFAFTECDGRFFELACDGDAWVYINGKLAMDMGGMLRGDRQYLELDRLEDLETGESHRMQIFFAHRSEEAAHFEIHTNLHLRTFTSGFLMAPLAD